MTRLITAAIALLASAICLEIALFGAGYLGPWLQSHMVAPWFVPACNLFTVACLVAVVLRHKRAASDEDGPLMPVVRRDPETGLRQL